MAQQLAQNLEEKTNAKTEVTMEQGTTKDRNAVALDEIEPSTSESGTKGKSECECVSTEEEHVKERGAHGSSEEGKRELGSEVYKYPFMAKWNAMNDLLMQKRKKREAEDPFDAALQRTKEKAKAMNVNDEERKHMIRQTCTEWLTRYMTANRREREELDQQYSDEACKAVDDILEYSEKQSAELRRDWVEIRKERKELDKELEKERLRLEKNAILLGFRPEEL